MEGDIEFSARRKKHKKDNVTSVVTHVYFVRGQKEHEDRFIQLSDKNVNCEFVMLGSGNERLQILLYAIPRGLILSDL